jgi:hypothetical protein
MYPCNTETRHQVVSKLFGFLGYVLGLIDFAMCNVKRNG